MRHIFVYFEQPLLAIKFFKYKINTLKCKSGHIAVLVLISDGRNYPLRANIAKCSETVNLNRHCAFLLILCAVLTHTVKMVLSAWPEPQTFMLTRYRTTDQP